MAFFGQKWKKRGWTLIGNEKFAFWKCLYFYSKMHWDQDISLFIFFSSYPFGAILDTLPLLQFWFCFFCFITDNQLQIYLSVRELFKKKSFFNAPQPYSSKVVSRSLDFKTNLRISIRNFTLTTRNTQGTNVLSYARRLPSNTKILENIILSYFNEMKISIINISPN